MFKIDRITALEIFTQFDDLHITTGKSKDVNMFGIGIYRGPGHNYKPMITSAPFAKTQEEAINKIKEILEFVCEFSKKDLEDAKSITAMILNPEGKEVDEAKTLNPKFIEIIIQELQQHQAVSTWEILKKAG